MRTLTTLGGNRERQSVTPKGNPGHWRINVPFGTILQLAGMTGVKLGLGRQADAGEDGLEAGVVMD